MNYQDLFVRPKPMPEPDTERLMMLRRSFDSLCFESEARIWPRHEWAVRRPHACKRCQQPLNQEL